LIANLSHFVLLCVNLLNRDANQRHIVCPFKGHPSRPQTLFKSSVNLCVVSGSKFKQDRLLK
jgi:hypothetical protein